MRRSIMSTLEAGEQVIEKPTGFGTVTNKRVIYFYKKGWFGSRTQADLPLRHVTSVRLEIYRNVIGGVFVLLVGLVLLLSGQGAVAMLVGLMLLALAVVVLWGRPTVVLTTAGGNPITVTGWPWTRADAEQFVSALRSQLFKE
jgi:hypothetical protein